MQVIGAGFGRTGTLSLKTALDRLGFGPCYHMVEVIENPAHAEAWYKACHGGSVDYSVFDGYRSVVDWPAVHYWRELIEHYPKAKVVLSIRDPESWYKSVSDTIYGRITTPVAPDAPEWQRRHRAMTRKIVLKETFGGRFLDKKHALEVFERHNDEVRKTVPPSRLFVYSVKEGWAPLCDFLGVPVPDEPFPRVNDTASFLAWNASDDWTRDGQAAAERATHPAEKRPD
ncbi:MAG TPA: sulfotransferase [Candidatus Eremiobacteraceae bacterium]|nr:sulfotransferase [Candidatus Eremiobacteraceae bacterium]